MSLPHSIDFVGPNTLISKPEKNATSKRSPKTNFLGIKDSYIHNELPANLIP